MVLAMERHSAGPRADTWDVLMVEKTTECSVSLMVVVKDRLSADLMAG